MIQRRGGKETFSSNHLKSFSISPEIPRNNYWGRKQRATEEEETTRKFAPNSSQIPLLNLSPLFLKINLASHAFYWQLSFRVSKALTQLRG
ncbi:hypothetical protein CEXT_446851 [Caerostris extrusa]|uniref:Ycf15 n=1 Tax=Caerostris extrusa TaxID=172846 RepID=A0AAV4SV14_CAEEX|nr:hypothetical protein CEXT_446851 [Caerostris extrusa]